PMAAELTIVKVGNTEWLLAKRTPCSRTRANVGVLDTLTLSGRRPSGINKIKLCGAWAQASAPLRSIRKKRIKKLDSRCLHVNKHIRILRQTFYSFIRKRLIRRRLSVDEQSMKKL